MIVTTRFIKSYFSGNEVRIIKYIPVKRVPTNTATEMSDNKTQIFIKNLDLVFSFPSNYLFLSIKN